MATMSSNSGKQKRASNPNYKPYTELEKGAKSLFKGNLAILRISNKKKSMEETDNLNMQTDSIEIGQQDFGTVPNMATTAATIEQPMQNQPMRMNMLGTDGDDETNSDESDENGINSKKRRHANQTNIGFDMAEFINLPVSTEVKELFSYIEAYEPHIIEIEPELKPFILDYIPAVGDVDLFLKVPRPDGVDDKLGLTILDEPSLEQSDPTVLAMHLKAASKKLPDKENRETKTSHGHENQNLEIMPSSSSAVHGSSKLSPALSEKTTALVLGTPSGKDRQSDLSSREIDAWINGIDELHRSKAPTSVHYSKPMPDIEQLMAEWPPQLEELLKTAQLPSNESGLSLEELTDVSCAILDIPIHKSRIQSLHVLFTLYSEFKNSQHFKNLANLNQIDNDLKAQQMDESDVGNVISDVSNNEGTFISGVDATGEQLDRLEL